MDLDTSHMDTKVTKPVTRLYIVLDHRVQVNKLQVFL